MNTATQPIYQPPRPNLGPEPWPAASPEALLVAAALVGSILVLLSIGVLSRFRRRVANVGPSHGDNPAVATDDRGHLIAAADRMRSLLVDRFGAEWSARTTEEIAAAPEIDSWLGEEAADNLRLLLRLADRAKFAGRSEDEFQGHDWPALADSVTARAAGASSSSSGK